MDCHEIGEGPDTDRRLRRPGRIPSAMGATVRTRLAKGLLIVGLLGATPAEAQRLSCGGHPIPGAGEAPDASFDPQHEDGQQPTIPEPASMNRERWEALVFNAYRLGPKHARYTNVLDRAVVQTIRICIQSPDTSYTGERLAPYSDASWWQRQIKRWTGLHWNGEIRIAACTDEPLQGWINVREGSPGEVREGSLAHTATIREYRAHLAGRWFSSEIIWNHEEVPVTEESYIEPALAHELGHVLGFFHAPRGVGYVMSRVAEEWSEEEGSLAQLAYQVGPNVRFPGLVRTGVTDHRRTGGHELRTVGRARVFFRRR